ncbi:hypothetical protein [Leminorella grimontii]|uniref:hypothetical protein n=1 Tax=Leminorella grimontii TaxID=82981 RepID=UPI002086E9BF|nr:hypothetical protein [Leminorella grimontii]GKX59040.1 hypothetical protein SOASR031_13550 [Leminorella grimontii]
MDNIIKNKCFLSFILIVLIAILTWIFIGIEIIHGEFKEDKKYDFFIKKHASTQIFFIDPTNCNAGCDTPAFNDLNEKELKQFSDYCFYRYGLFSAERCYDALYKKD